MRGPEPLKLLFFSSTVFLWLILHFISICLNSYLLKTFFSKLINSVSLWTIQDYISNFLHIFFQFLYYLWLEWLHFASKLLSEKNKGILPKSCHNYKVLLWAITYSQIYYRSKTLCKKEENLQIFQVLFNLMGIQFIWIFYGMRFEL